MCVFQYEATAGLVLHIKYYKQALHLFYLGDYHLSRLIRRTFPIIF